MDLEHIKCISPAANGFECEMSVIKVAKFKFSFIENIK
jgi:hypothetical protein